MNTPAAAHTFNRGWFSTVDVTSAVFKLKACRDAHIALAQYPGVTSISTYEIWIGKLVLLQLSLSARTCMTYEK